MAQGIQLSAGEYHPNDYFSRLPDDLIRVIVSQLLKQEAYGAIGFLRATSRRFYHAVKDSFDWNQLWQKHVGLGPLTSDDPVGRFCGHIIVRHDLEETGPSDTGCLRISPNGRIAVWGGYGSVLDLNQGSTIRTFDYREVDYEQNMYRLCCLDFSHTTQTAIMGRCQSDIFVAQGPILKRIPLRFHRIEFPQVALSQDGRWLVFEDGNEAHVFMLHLYALESMQESQAIELGVESLTAVSLNRDGRRAVTAQQISGVKLIDFSDNEQTYEVTFTEDACPWAVSLTEDGKTALIGLENGETLVWDWEQRVTSCTLKYSQQYVRKIAITPDKRWLVTGYQNGKVGVWDIIEKRFLIELDATLAETHVAGSLHYIEALAISSDGRTVLAQLCLNQQKKVPIVCWHF